MTVTVIHPAGIGDWPTGAVIDLDDRRARRLILIGYVEAVTEKPAKRKGKEISDGRAEHHPRV